MADRKCDLLFKHEITNQWNLVQPCFRGMLYNHKSRQSILCISSNTYLRSSLSIFPPSPSFLPRLTDASAYDSQTFMAELDKKAASCNYAGYVSKHVKYPPKGLLPLPGKSIGADKGCDLWDDIFHAALIVNPAFNMYRIFDTVSAHYILVQHSRDSLTHIYAVPYSVGRSWLPVSLLFII